MAHYSISSTGETILKVIEFRQTGLTTSLAAAVAGVINSRSMDRRMHLLFSEDYIPYAIRAGGTCAHLMSIPYEHYFEEDIDTCRRMWKIEVCKYNNERQKKREEAVM